MVGNPKLIRIGGRIISTLPPSYRVCWQQEAKEMWTVEEYDIRTEALDRFIKLKFDDTIRQIKILKLMRSPTISRINLNKKWVDVVGYDWKEFNNFVNPYA
ncbi:hypothetical protein CL634_02275 [bacterium]|nr:hypothetical protein [bacterium]